MKNLIKKSHLLFLILSFSTIVSFSQSLSMKSKICSSSNTIEMNISGYGTDNLIVTTDEVTPNGEASIIVVIDGTSNNGYFTLPNDGETYWFIYFDPNIEPVKIVNGGGGSTNYQYGCECQGGGGSCTLITTGDGHKGCTSSSCTGCCELGVIAFANPGGGVLIKGETVTINGDYFD